LLDGDMDSRKHPYEVTLLLLSDGIVRAFLDLKVNLFFCTGVLGFLDFGASIV